MGFNESAWELISKIPKGKVTTYLIIARRLGKPGAARAVGNACNRSPGMPRVPCHRVVKSDGSLGGFAHGQKNKEKMLKNEGIRAKEGKIVNFEGALFKFSR